MNNLYKASFADEAVVWDRFLTNVQKTSVNIFVMITPQRRRDVLIDVHHLVMASVTAKVCQEFIVASALSVQNNKLFTSLEGDNNKLTYGQQGDPDQYGKSLALVGL